MRARLLLPLLLAPALAAAAGALPRTATCIRVVDGDTLEIAAGRQTYRVRLIGVDTPEKYDSPKLRREVQRTGKDAASIQKLGQIASGFTALAVQGKGVYLEYDSANSSRGHRDKDDRLLAYVWYRAKRRRILLNGRIIRAGYGNALTTFPYKTSRRKQFVAAEREARRERRGLWSRTPPELPEPEIALVANRRSGVYHAANCEHAARISEANRVFFPSAEAAGAAGYRPCKACGGH